MYKNEKKKKKGTDKNVFLASPYISEKEKCQSMVIKEVCKENKMLSGIVLHFSRN